MRRLLLAAAALAVAALSAVSCLSYPAVVDKDTRQAIHTAVRFAYEGHRYIRFTYDLDLVPQGKTSSVVHDPECPCHGTLEWDLPRNDTLALFKPIARTPALLERLGRLSQSLTSTPAS